MASTALEIVTRLKETFTDVEDEFFFSFISKNPNKSLTTLQSNSLAEQITQAASAKMAGSPFEKPSCLSIRALESRVDFEGYIRYRYKPSREYDFDCPIENHIKTAEFQFLRMSNGNDSNIGNKRYSGVMRSTAQIKWIDYVVNPKLTEKYEETKRFLEERGTSTRELLLFHGTDWRNVDSILRNNFNLDMSKRQLFGNGLYFSEFPETSLSYGGGLILCRVLPGRVQTRAMGAIFDPDSGFDSFKVYKDGNDPTSLASSSSIHVVADPKFVLPYCVIELHSHERQKYQSIPNPIGSATLNNYTATIDMQPMMPNVLKPISNVQSFLPPPLIASTSTYQSQRQAMPSLPATTNPLLLRQIYNSQHSPPPKKVVSFSPTVSSLQLTQPQQQQQQQQRTALEKSGISCSGPTKTDSRSKDTTATTDDSDLIESLKEFEKIIQQVQRKNDLRERLSLPPSPPSSTPSPSSTGDHNYALDNADKESHYSLNTPSPGLVSTYIKKELIHSLHAFSYFAGFKFKLFPGEKTKVGNGTDLRMNGRQRVFQRQSKIFI